MWVGYFSSLDLLARVHIHSAAAVVRGGREPHRRVFDFEVKYWSCRTVHDALASSSRRIGGP